MSEETQTQIIVIDAERAFSNLVAYDAWIEREIGNLLELQQQLRKTMYALQFLQTPISGEDKN